MLSKVMACAHAIEAECTMAGLRVELFAFTSLDGFLPRLDAVRFQCPFHLSGRHIRNALILYMTQSMSGTFNFKLVCCHWQLWELSRSDFTSTAQYMKTLGRCQQDPHNIVNKSLQLQALQSVIQQDGYPIFFSEVATAEELMLSELNGLNAYTAAQMISFAYIQALEFPDLLRYCARSQGIREVCHGVTEALAETMAGKIQKFQEELLSQEAAVRNCKNLDNKSNSDLCGFLAQKQGTDSPAKFGCQSVQPPLLIQHKDYSKSPRAQATSFDQPFRCTNGRMRTSTVNAKSNLELTLRRHDLQQRDTSLGLPEQTDVVEDACQVGTIFRCDRLATSPKDIIPQQCDRSLKGSPPRKRAKFSSLKDARIQVDRSLLPPDIHAGACQCTGLHKEIQQAHHHDEHLTLHTTGITHGVSLVQRAARPMYKSSQGGSDIDGMLSPATDSPSLQDGHPVGMQHPTQHEVDHNQDWPTDTAYDDEDLNVLLKTRGTRNHSATQAWFLPWGRPKRIG